MAKLLDNEITFTRILHSDGSDINSSGKLEVNDDNKITSIFDVARGLKNAVFKGGAIEDNYNSISNTDRIFIDSQNTFTEDAFYNCPVANRSVKITSNSGSDTGAVIVRGVNLAGDEVTQTLTMTSGTITSSASFVFVNDVRFDSSNVPIGYSHLIEIQYDGASWFKLGYVVGGSFRNASWVVPNGKRVIVNEMNMWNNGWGDSFILRCRGVKNWVQGYTSLSTLKRAYFYKTGEYILMELFTKESSVCIAQPGDLIYCCVNLNNTRSLNGSFQMIQIDV